MPNPAPPFQRVLVANRGEIAVRVCRGLQAIGIEAVAVYSEPDARAPHVVTADLAVALGGESAQASYLDGEKVLAAARSVGASAIHPGYGFLSENADFARAVTDAGLTFIGPTPESMEILGSKQRAREAAEAAGVPVIPGLDPATCTDAKSLAAAAAKIGYPIMVKASGGGGGKGMRLVDRPEDLEDALAAGRREAASAFGDDRMLLEKAVKPARHVEIQILGDHHDQVVSLHERECSVQRRHQKVLEEAPSPAVDAELRARMGEAATTLARSVNYRGAGTVEFLLGPDGSFYFLEVNTRLQVEHPVTECVTGTDLVQAQVRVAAGAKLQELFGPESEWAARLQPRGWAMEARICAEVPEQGFLPATGTLQLVRDPVGPGVRVDSGVRSGSEVTVHYDSMLAKVIVHAPDRDQACAALSQALQQGVWLGMGTNVDFLRRVVDDPDYRTGNLRTDFLSLPEKAALATGPQDAAPDAAYIGALLSEMLVGNSTTASAGSSPPKADPASRGPWRSLAGFRLFHAGSES